MRRLFSERVEFYYLSGSRLEAGFIIGGVEEPQWGNYLHNTDCTVQ